MPDSVSPRNEIVLQQDSGRMNLPPQESAPEHPLKSSMFFRNHRAFIIILLFFVISRIAFVFFFPLEPKSDEFIYYHEASRFAGIHGFENFPRESLHSPGPKLLYSLPFRLFGNSLYVVGLFNTLLWILALISVYSGVYVIFKKKTAIWAAGLSLLSIPEIFYNNNISTEIPTVFFLGLIFFP